MTRAFRGDGYRIGYGVNTGQAIGSCEAYSHVGVIPTAAVGRRAWRSRDSRWGFVDLDGEGSRGPLVSRVVTREVVDRRDPFGRDRYFGNIATHHSGTTLCSGQSELDLLHPRPFGVIRGVQRHRDISVVPTVGVGSGRDGRRGRGWRGVGRAGVAHTVAVTILLPRVGRARAVVLGVGNTVLITVLTRFRWHKSLNDDNLVSFAEGEGGKEKVPGQRIYSCALGADESGDKVPASRHNRIPIDIHLIRRYAVCRPV